MWQKNFSKPAEIDTKKPLCRKGNPHINQPNEVRHVPLPLPSSPRPCRRRFCLLDRADAAGERQTHTGSHASAPHSAPSHQAGRQEHRENRRDARQDHREIATTRARTAARTTATPVTSTRNSAATITVASATTARPADLRRATTSAPPAKSRGRSCLRPGLVCCGTGGPPCRTPRDRYHRR